MTIGVERALKRVPIGGLVRCARSFYELLGNRRKAPRVPTSGNIFATVQGIVADTTYACMCVDISARGMAIDSRESLAVDTTVRLHSDMHGPRRLASVRYCLERNGSYRLGLEFISEPEMEARRSSAARAQATKTVNFG
jgi:hypothetical protein